MSLSKEHLYLFELKVIHVILRTLNFSCQSSSNNNLLKILSIFHNLSQFLRNIICVTNDHQSIVTT